MTAAIDPGQIPQYTGDFDTLTKAVTDLRKRAVGIRGAGQDVHSRFQATAAYYQAPEADQLLSSTQPVMDTADEFAGHIESLADALDTFVSEAKPHADRLQHLKGQAIAFVADVEGDDDWTNDQHKVDTHNALMDGVAEAVVGFRKAEHDAAVTIGAISPAVCRPVGDEGGTYGMSAKTLESMPDLPWGAPVSRTYERWSLGWWGHGTKSWAWDGIVKDSLWGGFVGLGTFEDNMLGVNGSDARQQTWDGLRRTVVGAYAYGMDAVGLGDHLSDWQHGSEAYAKDFGKQFIDYDEWQEDPARAHAVTSFNLLTLVGGAGGALAKLGRTGRFAEAAGTVAEVGNALDPVSGAARAARALSDLPKVSEVLTNVSEHLRLPRTRFPDSALDLSDRYRVDKDGRLIPINRDGTPNLAEAPHEPAAAERVSPTGPIDRELAGVGGRTSDAAPHGTAHAGGDAGPHAPTAAHHPGHTGHGGAGTKTAPTTPHGATGGAHGTGHDFGSHGGHHGPGMGHGSGEGPHHDPTARHGQHVPEPSGHIPEETFGHVLKGELKYGKDGQPKVVGYHFRPGGRDPYGIKVPKILKVDHRTGLTQGRVWMRDPRTGNWVMKRAKTTFFPPTWTERDVRRAMTKAFENGRVVNPEIHMWQGEYKGITFEGYFDPVTGDAKTVYPIMPD
ncbi:EndoU domain-containing protein [Streptomyces sp. LaBMicrA B280]|uniref:EndoU domain-containing protein n=1 Tax=Streptomyces sp. LaBMicrA B280 TaxID=3391001 RepID=UPI003BA6BAE8